MHWSMSYSPYYAQLLSFRLGVGTACIEKQEVRAWTGRYVYRYYSKKSQVEGEDILFW